MLEGMTRRSKEMNTSCVIFGGRLPLGEQIADQVLHVHLHMFGCSRTREGEEFSDERADPIDLRQRKVEELFAELFIRKSFGQQLREGSNGNQGIADFVREPSSHGPDRRQSLGALDDFAAAFEVGIQTRIPHRRGKLIGENGKDAEILFCENMAALTGSECDDALERIRRLWRAVLIGGAIGLVASLGLSRLLSTLLFGVGPFDPLTFGATLAVLAAAALVAAGGPALKALRVSPAEALHYE